MRFHLFFSLVTLLTSASLLHAQAPANDHFASATSLSGKYGFEITVDNTAATREAGEPNHSGYGGSANKSAWFRYVPTATGYFEVDVTRSTAPAPKAAIYLGTKLSSLVAIKRTTSVMKVELIKGKPYLIAVDADNVGDITLRCSWFMGADSAVTFEAPLPLLDVGEDEGWEPWEYGKITLTLAIGGGFSGNLELGQGTHRFTGRTQPGGSIVEIPRPDLPALRLNVHAKTFLGSISGFDIDFQPDTTQARSRLVSLRARQSSPLASFAGKHNFADIEVRSRLNGHGPAIGSLNITSKGAVSGTIILPDGETTTFASYLLWRGPGLAEQGEGMLTTCFHKKLYSGGGQVTGQLILNRRDVNNPLYTGDLHWVRQKASLSRKLLHRGTAADNIHLTMDRYIPPAPGSIIWSLQIPGRGAEDAGLFYSSLDHAAGWFFPIAISSTNRVTQSPPNAAIKNFTTTILPATGYISGGFTDGGIPVTYRAVYLPAIAVAHGIQTQAEGTTFMKIVP